ncbi:hypothetical protein [Bradyrhizobium sp. Tv2a-2]|uniref:hypothetical protein n=1 Tax=Bradyrhizobium sp. Tv2a-2 TaxID=113395 RepID=UPI00040C5147|nr:hypothetical protein [Bradyrhizobium sp. Tv2a-2]
MNKLIAVTALIASIIISPASAAPLTDEEKSYITIELGSLSVANICGYSVVRGSLSKLGDQMGVDDRIGTAAIEALKVGMGTDYDRAMLIPEVTRFVNETVDYMATASRNREAYCRKFAPVLLDRGTIEKKTH